MTLGQPVDSSIVTKGAAEVVEQVQSGLNERDASTGSGAGGGAAAGPGWTTPA